MSQCVTASLALCLAHLRQKAPLYLCLHLLLGANGWSTQRAAANAWQVCCAKPHDFVAQTFQTRDSADFSTWQNYMPQNELGPIRTCHLQIPKSAALPFFGQKVPT